MYSSLATSGSPLIYYFTIIMIIAMPIACFIIGIVNTRKKDKNSRRAGYAMLKLAGVLALFVAVACVYMYSQGGFSGPGYDQTTTVTKAIVETTTAVK